MPHDFTLFANYFACIRFFDARLTRLIAFARDSCPAFAPNILSQTRSGGSRTPTLCQKIGQFLSTLTGYLEYGAEMIFPRSAILVGLDDRTLSLAIGLAGLLQSSYARLGRSSGAARKTSWTEAMELRHWKIDSNPYSLPRPLVRDKLSTRLRVALLIIMRRGRAEVPVHSAGQGCCRRQA